MRNTAALGAVLVLVACGGSTPKSPSAPPPADGSVISAGHAATGATVDAGSSSATSDVAGTSSTTAGAPGTTGVSSPAATSGADANVIAEGHDECSGIAAPFEERVRAKFNECYQAGKKTNPELAGTIKVTLKVDVKGKVRYVPEPSKLDAKVVTCMVNAVKKEPFDAKACRGKDVAVSKTYGPR